MTLGCSIGTQLRKKFRRCEYIRRKKLPLRYFIPFKLYFQYSAPQGDISISHAKRIRGFKRSWYLLKGFCFNIFIHKAICTSDVVFPISEFHKTQLAHLIGRKEMAPITMGVENNWLEIENSNINRLNDLTNGKKVVTYFGSLSFSRNPQFLITLFAKIKHRYPNSIFIMMGSGVDIKDEAFLRKLCRKLNVFKDVIFTGHVSRQIVKKYLLYTDLTVSAIPPESHYQISSPTKIYESMGLGVPVVGNMGISEQENVLIESGGGVLVKYDLTEFSNAIVHLLNNPDIVQEMGKKGRAYIIENYTYEMIASKVAKYFM
jgi:glycosyltransferase involved in cell wall biosynthesis